jgi:DNA-binding CsgD family transcriptional regulator
LPTARELDVLLGVADGLTSKAIGSRLDIDTRTVDNHIAWVSIRLGAPSRAEAVAIALRRRVVN